MESYERKTEDGWVKGRKYTATIKSLRDDGMMEIYDNGKSKKFPVVTLELMSIGDISINPFVCFPRLLTEVEKQILLEPGNIYSFTEDEHISRNYQIGETYRTVNTLKILNSERTGWKIQGEYTRHFPLR